MICYPVEESWSIQDDFFVPVGHLFSILDEDASTEAMLEQNPMDVVVDDSMLEPTLENALLFNKAAQTQIVDLLQQLEVIKTINQNRLKSIHEKIK